ncbi:MAG TPA: hypothetical protein VFN57_10275 [Thermomicrobiaceae bacterium]|nr:hypothetical protein [Thermomicrobiaceae bacterium]
MGQAADAEPGVATAVAGGGDAAAGLAAFVLVDVAVDVAGRLVAVSADEVDPEVPVPDGAVEVGVDVDPPPPQAVPAMSASARTAMMRRWRPTTVELLAISSNDGT